MGNFSSRSLPLLVAGMLLFAIFQLTVPVVAQTNDPIVVENAGLVQPESVAYDPIDQVYLVSNINGVGPDTKSFISRVSPEGKILTLKWIDGANPSTPLQTTAGIAIQGETIYVVDRGVVRLFERATGKAKTEIKIADATGINDIAVAPDGTFYVGDLGLNFTATGFQPSGNDAIYKVTPDGKVTLLYKNTGLGFPNGISVLPSGEPLVVSYNNSAEYYTVSANGRANIKKLAGSGGQFDGVISLPDGTLFISSWADKAVYQLTPDGKNTMIIKDVEAPADFGYDTKRGRILLPLLNSSKLIIYPVTSSIVPLATPATGEGGGMKQTLPDFLVPGLILGAVIITGWLGYSRSRRNN